MESHKGEKTNSGFDESMMDSEFQDWKEKEIQKLTEKEPNQLDQERLATYRSEAPQDRALSFFYFTNNFYTTLPGGAYGKTIDFLLSKRGAEDELVEEGLTLLEDVKKCIELLQIRVEDVSGWTATIAGDAERIRRADLLKRIYIEMRKLGYSHQELRL